MRVLHYLSGFRREYGGPVESVAHLCNGLSEIGVNVTVLSADLTDAPPAWLDAESAGPTAFRLTMLHRATSSTTSMPVMELVRHMDVVHIHSLFDRGALLVGRSAYRAGIPYVVSPRGSLDDWSLAQKRMKKRAFLYLYGRLFLRRAHTIHFTAEPERRQALAVVRPARWSVLPNTFDLREFQARTGEKPAENIPTVLFLSRLHPKKGLEHLLDAVAELRKAEVCLRLVVAGSGDAAYEKELVQRCSVRGISDLVSFVGSVWGDERTRAYQSADLFVLPTSSENFGRVLFEALACGTPVLTTNGVCAIAELVASGGAVAVDQDPHLLAIEIRRLLSDPTLLRSMGAKGASWVRTHLSASVVAQRYKKDYNLILESCQSSYS